MVTRRFAVLAPSLVCTLLVCGSLLFSAPPPLAAPGQNDDSTMEGKITEKSPGKLTINSGENMIFHVLYDDKTEITKKDGSPGTDQDLRRGVTISATGPFSESGAIAARKISIEADGSEKK
jgi:hypothetical protein